MMEHIIVRALIGGGCVLIGTGLSYALHLRRLARVDKHTGKRGK